MEGDGIADATFRDTISHPGSGRPVAASRFAGMGNDFERRADAEIRSAAASFLCVRSRDHREHVFGGPASATRPLDASP